MKSIYNFEAKFEGKSYPVSKIDFNNEMVNLNGADIIELDNDNLDLYICGKSYKKSLIEIPVNVACIFNDIIKNVKNESYFDNKSRQFVIPIDKVCGMIDMGINDFKDMMLK